MRSAVAVFLLLMFCVPVSINAQTHDSIALKDTIIYKPYKQGKARFSYAGRMGIIDTSGKIILPAVLTSPIYDMSGRDRWYYYVRSEQKSGIIDTNYTIILSPIYDHIGFFMGGHFSLQLNDKSAYADRRGKLVGTWYDDVKWFSSDSTRAPVKQDGQWGFIDSTGKMIIAPAYDFTYGFSEYQLAPVKLNGKWGFIDKAGLLRIPLQYQEAWTFTQGLCPVKTSGKWGYIDTSGTMIIPAMYDRAEPFFCELTAVKKNGRYGFINQKNETIIDFRFRKAYPFGARNLYTRVRSGFFHWYSIDKKGQCVLDCR